MGGAYHHDRPRPFLVFLVEHGFIAVCPEIKSTDPRRRPSHLLTDGVQGYTHAALDDEFIMDVAADKAVQECFHGVHEDVPQALRLSVNCCQRDTSPNQITIKSIQS